MPFDTLKVNWLRATKASFERGGVRTELDPKQRKDLFVKEIRNLHSDQSDQTKVTTLAQKIDQMPTKEFWELYGRDFSLL